MNIFSLIKNRSRSWRDNPAIHDDAGSLSYSDLILEAEECSAELNKHGVKEGTCLAIMSKNSREFITAILAGLDCGATVMPLSNKMTADEFSHLLAEAEVHYIIDDSTGIKPSEKGKDVAIGKSVMRFSALREFKERFAPHVKNPAFIRFTSGTTGKSKGVIISHQSVKERIEAANKGLKLGPEDAVIWVLPIAYHFVVSIMLYLYYGSAIVLCNDFMAKAIVGCAKKVNGTMLYASPMHIRLLAGDAAVNTLGGLKRVISTSAGISLELCESFRKKFHIPVSQAFGIIEVGLPIINLQKSSEHPDAAGYALPDYEAEVLDDDCNILPAMQSGSLAIKGPGMFDGYLSPPQTRDEILKNGWFITGDLASKHSDGLIKIEGRKKSMINVSGNKVFPEEVEGVIDAHPAVSASRVFGNSHPLLGEMVEAEVVLKNGMSLEGEDLLRYCRSKLTSFKVPQKIKVVTSIAETGSGKVKRHP